MSASNTITTLAIGPLLTGLFGGLALFLYGMDLMTEGLKKVAGDRLKNLLAKLTTNRIKGALTGAFVTAIIQSSSVTTVLVVGFISAGLISVTQSIGIIMGANIGTTITAQIIAFKVTKYALVMISVGFGLQFFVKKESIKYYGAMLLGIGLVFFGMDLMSTATTPLRSYEPFIEMMQQMKNPLFGILISALFTAIIQSSSATTGIVIVLASQGFITLEVGISMAFGANIGTCATAILASIGKPREALQASLVHIIFNVLGVVLWYNFIDLLADFVRSVSPVAKIGLIGADKLGAETPRQIANAHTIFNIANTLIFLWFTVPLGWLVQKIAPAKPKSNNQSKPQFLQSEFLSTPDLALNQVRRELGRLGNFSLNMVKNSLHAVLSGSREEIAKIHNAEEEVNQLHEAIITYLARVARRELTAQQLEVVHDLMAVANYIENIGDITKSHMVALGFERIDQGIEIREDAEESLQALFQKVIWSIESSIQAVLHLNKELANQVITLKPEIRKLANEAHLELADLFSQKKEISLSEFRAESDIIENLRRQYYLAKCIAKVTAEVDILLNKHIE
ncbi:MAG: phosphate:Na+ symporter [bacterium]|jgi:phosphate:Na+ symporter